MLEVFIPSLYGVCSDEIYKQLCWLEIFCAYSDDSTNRQNLTSCGSISPKTVLIFPKNIHNFRSNMIEKQVILNFSSYSSKSYASVVLWDSEVIVLGVSEEAAFYPFLAYVLSVLYNRRNMSPYFLINHTPRRISSMSATFPL